MWELGQKRLKLDMCQSYLIFRMIDGVNVICFQVIHKRKSPIHFFLKSNLSEIARRSKFIKSSPLSTFSQTPPSHQSSTISSSERNYCKQVSVLFFGILLMFWCGDLTNLSFLSNVDDDIDGNTCIAN